MLDFSPYQKDIACLFQDGLDLERLRDKTILVVGATGLVGGCVVDVLMQNPARCYKVIAAGRNKERARQKFAAYWEDESFFFAKIDVTQPIIKSMNSMIVDSVYDELAEGADYIIDAASNASPNFFSRGTCRGDESQYQWSIPSHRIWIETPHEAHGLRFFWRNLWRR